MKRPSKSCVLLSICVIGGVLCLFQMESLSHMLLASQLSTPLLLDRWHAFATTNIDIPNNCSRPPRSPNPKTKIHFHFNKGCDSDTLSSIFIQYGIKHKLKFIQTKGHNRQWQREFNLADFHIPKNETMDLFVTENVVDSRQIDVMLGAKDVVHIATVCKPGIKLETMYSMCRLERCFEKSIAEFVEYDDLVSISSDGLGRAQKLCPELTHPNQISNPVAYGFGFNPAQFSNFSYAMEAGEKVTQRYDLILLPETWNKGLILMRDLLGWSTNDVITFPKNGGRHGKYLKSWELRQLDQIQLIDDMIYKHILKQSLATLEKYNCYLQPEVGRLKEATRRLKGLCIENPEIAIYENRAKKAQCSLSGLKLSEKAQNEPDCYLRTWSINQLISHEYS